MHDNSITKNVARWSTIWWHSGSANMKWVWAHESTKDLCGPHIALSLIIIITIIINPKSSSICQPWTNDYQTWTSEHQSLVLTITNHKTHWSASNNLSLTINQRGSNQYPPSFTSKALEWPPQQTSATTLVARHIPNGLVVSGTNQPSSFRTSISLLSWLVINGCEQIVDQSQPTLTDLNWLVVSTPWQHISQY